MAGVTVTNVCGVTIGAEMFERSVAGGKRVYQYHTVATAGDVVFIAGALEVAIVTDGTLTTVDVNGILYPSPFSQVADNPHVSGFLPEYTVGAGCYVVIVYNSISS